MVLLCVLRASLVLSVLRELRELRFFTFLVDWIVNTYTKKALVFNGNFDWTVPVCSVELLLASDAMKNGGWGAGFDTYAAAPRTVWVSVVAWELIVQQAFV